MWGEVIDLTQLTKEECSPGSHSRKISRHTERPKGLSFLRLTDIRCAQVES